ncbi:hypothetical protein KHA90_01440 [Flavobacterium psychroterrae]|uniref:Uncharacterized protein n=1 Tax=Flavobacterium psychroterrae TaxID=2133767 RepID=A0ABS5P731_9FLAO|nr:hypothetical protein [Flavobacterium psychroterrae]MBS7229673.1 hypothetical protein [Flavobacterium psychroterrae]
MTYIKKLFLTTTIAFCSYNLALAKARIPIGKIDKLEIVADLPNTDEYLSKEESNTHLDLARLHQEYSIAWIPVWITQEPKLILAKEHSDRYYELSNEEIEKIISANKLKKEQLLKLGFYTQYGGKILLFLLVCLILYGLFGKDKKKDVKPINL